MKGNRTNHGPHLPFDVRLSANIDKRGSEECWLYVGPLDPNGYPRQITEGKTRYFRHRKVYEKEVGTIPEGFVVDHICHDPSKCMCGSECPHRRCLNPAHLKAVTKQENMSADRCASGRVGVAAANKARTERTHCPAGHERTSENLYRNPTTNKHSCKLCAKVQGDQYRERKRTQKHGTKTEE